MAIKALNDVAMMMAGGWQYQYQCSKAVSWRKGVAGRQGVGEKGGRALRMQVGYANQTQTQQRTHKRTYSPLKASPLPVSP